MENVVPSFRRYDAPAMCTRDVAKREQYVGAWLDQKPTKFGDIPISIIYLNESLPNLSDEQMKLIDQFIEDMEQTFDTSTQEVSIADTWKANPPTDANRQSVGANAFVHDVYHTMTAFRSGYQAQFGLYPYINPVTGFRWNSPKGYRPLTTGRAEAARCVPRLAPGAHPSDN
ncbi:hypothetical protein VPNG_05895 [Cytospora leucostoma]|uniref:Uncharacterized protein n=1 Tax=Cytospora leucostoma TaxID=1230097 RepID=A0A423X0F0_9PEZI|nr:hypothetical protein VPNG_05895 [Cytospora leucostoma]